MSCHRCEMYLDLRLTYCLNSDKKLSASSLELWKLALCCSCTSLHTCCPTSRSYQQLTCCPTGDRGQQFSSLFSHKFSYASLHVGGLTYFVVAAIGNDLSHDAMNPSASWLRSLPMAASTGHVSRQACKLALKHLRLNLLPAVWAIVRSAALPVGNVLLGSAVIPWHAWVQVCAVVSWSP